MATGAALSRPIDGSLALGRRAQARPGADHGRRRRATGFGLQGEWAFEPSTSPSPQSLDDVEASVTTAGRGLGTAAGRDYAASQAGGAAERAPPPDAADTIWLGGGGQQRSAPDRLEAQWMRLAGLRAAADPLAIACQPGDCWCCARRPILLRSRLSAGPNIRPGSAGSTIRCARPLSSQVIATDGRPWTCMGPLLIERDRAAARAGAVSARTSILAAGSWLRRRILLSADRPTARSPGRSRSAASPTLILRRTPAAAHPAGARSTAPRSAHQRRSDSGDVRQPPRLARY